MRKTAATDPYILPVWPYHIRTGYDQLTCKKFAHPYRLRTIWYRYSCWVYRHLLIEEHMTMQFVCTNIQKLYLSPWLNVEILDVHANHAWKQFFLQPTVASPPCRPRRPSTHKCGSNECYLDSKSSHLTKVAWLKSFQPLHGPTSLSELPDNKGLASTYLSLWYTCTYWRNAYYTHKCSFTRPYLPGLHILESLLAIDRPVIIQISLAWSSVLTLVIQRHILVTVRPSKWCGKHTRLANTSFRHVRHIIMLVASSKYLNQSLRTQINESIN